MGGLWSQCVRGNAPDRERPRKTHNHDYCIINKTSPQPNNAIPTANGSVSIPMSEIEAKMEERLKQPLDIYYKMDHKNRGLALIFNHETFSDFGLGVRKGTQVDRDRLQKTFAALDFDVRILNNPSELEIRGTLKKVAAMDHSDNDCLVIIVLSHGELVPYYDFKSGDESHTILSHDLMSHAHSKDTMYPLQMIWSYFTDENCPTLKNKPRIFLIQACQGKQTDPGIKLISKRSLGNGIETDSIYENQDSVPFERIKAQPLMAQRGMSIDETDGVPYEPITVKPILPQKDFLIVYSSLPGFYSFRNIQHGAWFIQSLCKEIDEREYHYDFMKILTLASQAVAYDYESHSYEIDLDQKKQIPCIHSMLTKLLLFQKKRHITNGY